MNPIVSRMANEFQLGGIVPWGRTAAEYEAFFQLSDVPRAARILDCGGGPSSFAAEWAARGYFTTTADPLYARSSKEIAARFEVVAASVLRGMQDAYDRFNWSFYVSPERVVELRRGALEAFLHDFESPRRAARYVAARLPVLPFAAGTFDVVLCSHLLFLYSDEIDESTHIASVEELLRVGREVRLFPLIDMHGQPSRHVQPMIEHFRAEVDCRIVQTPFEFQRGGSTMLRLSRAV